MYCTVQHDFILNSAYTFLQQLMILTCMFNLLLVMTKWADSTNDADKVQNYDETDGACGSQ